MSYIFLHGLGQNSSSWDNVIVNFKDKNNLYCPDLINLCTVKDITYQNLYNSFCKYCEDLETPFNICGLSLGSIIALQYAIENPEKVKSLVLIGTQYKMPKILLNLQNIIFKFMPNNIFKELGVEKYDFINLTKSMNNLDFTRDLQKIKCKTLILCGEKDIANKSSCKKINKLIINSNLKFIKNSGHIVNIDSPYEVSTILNNFYENLD